MNFHFQEVTENNYLELIGLEVKEDQKDNFFYGSTKPNIMSLAQAHVIGGVVLVACLGNEMVGSVYYHPDTSDQNEEGRAWLTRMMIDKKFQGRGLGRKTMLLLIERIKEETKGGTTKLGLSYEPHNKVAENLYRSLGFEQSGKPMKGQTVVWRNVDLINPE